MFLGYTKVANVYIGNKVFIGAGSVILPGVKIGDEVVIGAGSVVAKDVPSKSVVAGVPAKVICSLDDYLNKNKTLMFDDNVFDASFTLRNPDFGAEQAEKIKNACEQRSCAFVE
jgi:maltose O-acetyltransferase